jgi:hypothetical protein
MDGQPLGKAPNPFPGCNQSAGIEPPLQIALNPFSASASGPRMACPVQRAFSEVVRQIGLKIQLVVVVGGAGTGKSLLADVTARACAEMGLSVRHVQRGDLVHMACDQKCDVLLVDEADSVANLGLQTLTVHIATTVVLFCLPSAASRFDCAGAHASVVEVPRLTPSEARNYLREMGAGIGRPNLFTPEAVDLLIDGSRGVPRLLRSIGDFAFFMATSEGATQVRAEHVATASKGRLACDEPLTTAEDSGATSGTNNGLKFAPETAEHDYGAVAGEGRFGAPIRASQIRRKEGVDAIGAPVAFDVREKRGDTSPSALPCSIVAEKPPEAPSQAFAHQHSLLERAKREPGFLLGRPRAQAWISRSLRTGGLAASLVIAGIISFNLWGVHAPTAFSAISQPLGVTKGRVREPAHTKSKVAEVVPLATPTAVEPAQARSALLAPAPEANPADVTGALLQPGAVDSVPPLRSAVKRTELAKFRKFAHKDRSQSVGSDHSKSAGESVAYTNAPGREAGKVPELVDDPASQEDKTQEDKITAGEIEAERAKVAELSTFQAAEQARRPSTIGGPTNQAKADDADEKARAARQISDRMFFHTVMGFGG